MARKSSPARSPAKVSGRRGSSASLAWGRGRCRRARAGDRAPTNGRPPFRPSSCGSGRGSPFPIRTRAPRTPLVVRGEMLGPGAAPPLTLPRRGLAPSPRRCPLSISALCERRADRSASGSGRISPPPLENLRRAKNCPSKVRSPPRRLQTFKRPLGLAPCAQVRHRVRSPAAMRHPPAPAASAFGAAQAGDGLQAGPASGASISSESRLRAVGTTRCRGVWWLRSGPGQGRLQGGRSAQAPKPEGTGEIFPKPAGAKCASLARSPPRELQRSRPPSPRPGALRAGLGHGDAPPRCRGGDGRLDRFPAEPALRTPQQGSAASRRDSGTSSAGPVQCGIWRTAEGIHRCWRSTRPGAGAAGRHRRAAPARTHGVRRLPQAEPFVRVHPAVPPGRPPRFRSSAGGLVVRRRSVRPNVRRLCLPLHLRNCGTAGK